MTVPSRERWWVDGYELTDGWFRDVSTRDGLYQMPFSRGQDQFVGGRHGALSSGGRKYGPGQFILQLWLADDRRALWEQAYDTLARVISPVHRLPTYTRQLADGSQRTCKGRVFNQQPEPTAIGQLAASIEVQVEVPGVFWRDVVQTSDTTGPGAGTPTTLPLTSKGRSTAPLIDLVYRIDGPIANPTVTVTSDPEVQDSFSYSGVIPAGQYLMVDTATWTVSGGGGLDADPTLLSWTGDYILEVPPAPYGWDAPTLRLDGAAVGVSTALTVSGYAAYLL